MFGFISQDNPEWEFVTMVSVIKNVYLTENLLLQRYWLHLWKATVPHSPWLQILDILHGLSSLFCLKKVILKLEFPSSGVLEPT